LVSTTRLKIEGKFEGRLSATWFPFSKPGLVQK